MSDNIDEKRIDDAALALLWLTLHDENRVWKQLDWCITNRLHDKGLISNPRTKAKSVMLTDEGLQRAERVFDELFTKQQ